MKSKQTRRKFLRNGLLAVTSASVAPAIAGSIKVDEEKEKNDLKLPTEGMSAVYKMCFSVSH